MPQRLSFRQRLTGYDGRPTAQAKLALGALVAVAFATGFLLHPGSEEPAPQVAASNLDGEVAGATGTPEAQRLGLRAAASLPALRRPARRPSRRRSRPKAPVPVTTPVATPTPTPEASEPVVDTPPPAAAAPAPTAAPPAAPPTAPDPPSGEIFDSTG